MPAVPWKAPPATLEAVRASYFINRLCQIGNGFRSNPLSHIILFLNKNNSQEACKMSWIKTVTSSFLNADQWLSTSKLDQHLTFFSYFNMAMVVILLDLLNLRFPGTSYSHTPRSRARNERLFRQTTVTLLVVKFITWLANIIIPTNRSPLLRVWITGNDRYWRHRKNTTISLRTQRLNGGNGPR